MSDKFSSPNVEYNKDAQHDMSRNICGHATYVQEHFVLRVIPGCFTIFRTNRVLHKPLKKEDLYGKNMEKRQL